MTVIFANAKEELTSTIEDVITASTRIELQLNIGTNTEPVEVGHEALDKVQTYTYLGQIVRTGKAPQEEEVNRSLSLDSIYQTKE